jgi:hypothetical protein
VEYKFVTAYFSHKQLVLVATPVFTGVFYCQTSAQHHPGPLQADQGCPEKEKAADKRLFNEFPESGFGFSVYLDWFFS